MTKGWMNSDDGRHDRQLEDKADASPDGTEMGQTEGMDRIM